MLYYDMLHFTHAILCYVAFDTCYIILYCISDTVQDFLNMRLFCKTQYPPLTIVIFYRQTLSIWCLQYGYILASIEIRSHRPPELLQYKSDLYVYLMLLGYCSVVVLILFLLLYS